MNFELYIENLGAIEKAEMTINPLTILAGENGTGKSFVTKFLYSVLNVLMRDVYKIELLKNCNDFLDNFNEIQEFISISNSDIFLKVIDFINEIKVKSLNTENILGSRKTLFDSNIFNNLISLFNDEINHYVKIITEKKQEYKNLDEIDIFYDYRKMNTINMLGKNKFILESIYFMVYVFDTYYPHILKNYIISELKDNFQISNIGQIIKKGQEKLIFEVKNIVKIEIVGDDLVVKDFQITNNLSKINRLTFFESPIYWRLSMELIENASRPKNYYLSDKISDERLTGVPKYFLDLRELLFSRFEKGEKEPFIEQCANDLQKSLNGKFNTDSYDLSFETNQGQTINKTLVSFGMTNLGILQAVLNRNIINKGSFVFIDEPESNLHPEWQAVLADILVKLAENGVFVVMTTHSSDMLKALDFYTTNKEQDKFISINYFEKNGKLSEFDEQEIKNIGKLGLISVKLLEPYASFTFAKKGGFFDD